MNHRDPGELDFGQFDYTNYHPTAILAQRHTLPTVAICVPVRDRAWVLPLCLDAVLRLDYPHELLSLYVLVNDSVDGTDQVAEWFYREAVAAGFRIAGWAQRDFGTTVDNNDRRNGLGRDYKAFGQAREACLAMRDDEELVLQLDSDVQVLPNTLRRLVAEWQATQEPMIAAVIDNTAGGTCEWYCNVLQRWPESGRYYHDPGAHVDRAPGIRPCAMTGAVVLQHASLFDGRFTYLVGSDDQRSEDGVFCEGLIAAGIIPQYAPIIRCNHWMRAPEDLGYERDPDHHRRLAAFHAARAEFLSAATPRGEEVIDAR